MKVSNSQRRLLQSLAHGRVRMAATRHVLGTGLKRHQHRRLGDQLAGIVPDDMHPQDLIRRRVGHRLQRGVGQRVGQVAGFAHCVPSVVVGVGLALPAGQRVLSAVARDAAGNTGSASQPVTVTVDPYPPVAPVMNAPQYSSSTRPLISGRAEAASTLRLYDGNKMVAEVVATADGAWTFTPSEPWTEGSHPLTAVAVDAAGNTTAGKGFAIGSAALVSLALFSAYTVRAEIAPAKVCTTTRFWYCFLTLYAAFPP